MIVPLHALILVIEPYLAGQKFAVQSGSRLLVSPAMHDLISHAEGEELERLLRAIELRRIPDFLTADFSLHFPVSLE